MLLCPLSWSRLKLDTSRVGCVIDVYLLCKMYPITSLSMFGSVPYPPSAVSSCARVIEVTYSSCSPLFFWWLLAALLLNIFDVHGFIFSSIFWIFLVFVIDKITFSRDESKKINHLIPRTWVKVMIQNKRSVLLSSSCAVDTVSSRTQYELVVFVSIYARNCKCCKKVKFIGKFCLENGSDINMNRKVLINYSTLRLSSCLFLDLLVRSVVFTTD